MCAGNGDHMAPLQYVLRQPLRAAGVGQSSVQNGLHQLELGAAIGHVRPADDVADDENIGFQRQLVGCKTFDQFNAESAQLVAHGRVNADVTASHLVACIARQRCQPAHKGSANAKNMNMH